VSQPLDLHVRELVCSIVSRNRYVQTLLAKFGPARLLWGSDFSPCLSHLSFPQTIDLFARMPFLSRADRAAIEGGTLLRLLHELDTRRHRLSRLQGAAAASL
jgi:hypothetical protein